MLYSIQHIHTEDTNSNNSHFEVLKKTLRHREMADMGWRKDLYI